MWEIVLSLVVFGIGYVARKYAEKIWPEKVALLDTTASKYVKIAKEIVRKTKVDTEIKPDKS
jgi:hypothetical protein